MHNLLHPLLLLALALFAKTSLATDHYIDASIGNDTWSGTYPEPQPIGCDASGCTDGPKQGLVASNQGELLPGDRVFLRCGQTWHDTLSVVNSGTIDAPIAFSSYGPDCANALPTISGSDRIQNWVPDTGQTNVYVADLAMPVNQVFIDGQYLKLAQYPNTGYLFIDKDSGTELLPGCIDGGATGSGSCFLEDSDLSVSNDLVGSGIHIRTRKWLIEDRIIIDFDQSAAKIFWDVDTNYSVRQDYGYYLDNKRWMLDSPGEWYHDSTQGKLYVWLSDSDDPNQHIVEASVRENLFDARNTSYVSLSSIAFVRAAQYGIYMNTAKNFSIDSVAVSDSGKHGIKITSNSFGVLNNSVIQRSVQDGIEVKNSSGTSITGNQVTDSGVVGSPKNSFAAIDASGSDGVNILDNKITNAGYIGIRFKRDTVIQDNIIRNTCLVLDDCSAIYTYANSEPNPPFNSLVDSNIIMDIIGNSEGHPANGTLTTGVGLDGLSNGVSVTNNIIINVDHGIKFDAYNHLLANNILFGNRENQIDITETGAAGSLYGNRVENNTLFPLVYQWDIMVMRTDSDNNAFASFGNNLYSLVHANRVATESYVPTATGRLVTEFDFPAWQSQREPDAEAIAPFSIAQSRLDSANSNNIISNSTFTSDTSSWTKKPANSTKNWQANCSWDNGCLSYLAAPDLRSLLTSNSISLIEGRHYLAEFAIRGGFADQTINVNVRRYESGKHTAVGLKSSIKIGTQWAHHRLVFSATQTLSTARLEFEVAAGETIEIDDVHLFEVNVNDPIDDALILVNEGSTLEAIQCPDAGTLQSSRCGEYITADGVPADWPLTIAARSAEIVIWAANPFQDSDFDTLADVDDNCVYIANSPQKDADQDGRGDSCDQFPADPAEWLDTDGDGTGNNADLDDDNDSLKDTEELVLGTAPLLVDTDGDMASDGLEVSAGTNPLDPGSTPEIPDGDVNTDGKVDVADLLICMRVLTDQYLPTPTERYRMDIAPMVNGISVPDGKITVGDYVVLQRRVMGNTNF